VDEFLNSIPELFGISEEAGKNLFSAGFTSIESFKGVSKDDLKAIDKIGDVTAERIVASVNSFFLQKENEQLKSENEKLSERVGAGLPKKCFGNFDNAKRPCRVCQFQFECESV
jgi:NAD-dependent DNA ligase